MITYPDMEYLVKLIAYHRLNPEPVRDILNQLLPMDQAEDYIKDPPLILLDRLTKKTANLQNPIWSTWYKTFGQHMMSRFKGIVQPFPVEVMDDISIPSYSMVPAILAQCIRTHNPQSVLVISPVKVYTLDLVSGLDTFYYPCTQFTDLYPCILTMKTYMPLTPIPDLCIIIGDKPIQPLAKKIIRMTTQPRLTKITIKDLLTHGYVEPLLPIIYKTENWVDPLSYLMEFHKYRKIMVYVHNHEIGKDLYMKILAKYPQMMPNLFYSANKTEFVNATQVAIAIVCRMMETIPVDAIVLFGNRDIRKINLPRTVRCVLAVNDNKPFIEYWKDQGMTTKAIPLERGANYLL